MVSSTTHSKSLTVHVYQLHEQQSAHTQRFSTSYSAADSRWLLTEEGCLLIPSWWILSDMIAVSSCSNAGWCSALWVTCALDCSTTNIYGCSYLIIKWLPWTFELGTCAAASPEATTTCNIFLIDYTMEKFFFSFIDSGNNSMTEVAHDRRYEISDMTSKHNDLICIIFFWEWQQQKLIQRTQYAFNKCSTLVINPLIA